MKWISRETRQAAKELQGLQKDFKGNQDVLKSHGLEDADIAVVTSVNKVQRVVAQCKKSHGGPLSDIAELHESVNKFAINGVEKKLHTILNLEIRYRKFTMTNVKDICPLFCQKGLTVEVKVKNLELLLDSQNIGFNANATMDDLKNAIMHVTDENKTEDENESENLTTTAATTTDVGPVESLVTMTVDEDRIAEPDNTVERVEQTTLSSFWPPKETEFMLALLEDGFYIGHVDVVRGEELQLNYLVPKSSSDRRYWVWPEREDIDWIKKDYIMEIYPSLRIETKLSTKRKIVYELMNEDIINVIVQFC